MKSPSSDATLPAARAEHVKTAIAKLRKIVGDKPFDSVRMDDALWPALERYLEIVSEASRHLPEEWKSNMDRTFMAPNSRRRQPASACL
jgi:uncharacterized protein with HEPN domain